MRCSLGLVVGLTPPQDLCIILHELWPYLVGLDYYWLIFIIDVNLTIDFMISTSTLILPLWSIRRENEWIMFKKTNLRFGAKQMIRITVWLNRQTVIIFWDDVWGFDPHSLKINILILTSSKQRCSKIILMMDHQKYFT